MSAQVPQTPNLSIRCPYCKKEVAANAPPGYGNNVVLLPHTGARGLCPGSGTIPKKSRR